MGNYRFRFSNVIPNSWFSKLKDTSTTNKVTKKQPSVSVSSLSLSLSSSSSSSLSLSSVPSGTPVPGPHPAKSGDDDQRKSYYFTRELTAPDPNICTRSSDPPRKSSKKKRPITQKKPAHRKPVSVEHNSAERCSFRVTPESAESTSSDNELPSSGGDSLNCSCITNSLSDDVYGKVDLPRIITKASKPDEFGSGKWVIEEGSRSLSVKVMKEDIPSTHTHSPIRRLPGGKMKGNNYSPRVGNRVKVQAINGGRRSNGKRRSLSESMAVVKTSVDPQKDFKESMVEMIMENNMKSSKDLEDLLACYLSLNSDEYHELIIKVFKQIWFESSDIIRL